MLIELIGHSYFSIAEKFFDSCSSLSSHFSPDSPLSQIRETAHQLKGSAGNLGFTRLEAFFASLESTAIAGHPPSNHTAYSLQTTLDATRKSLISNWQ